MRALCTLPNASTLIGGVVFEQTPQGLLSGPLSPEEAARFGAIPGYVLVDEDPPAVAQPPEQPATRRATRKSDEHDPKS